ncbi:MAG: hypothetical protein ABSB40_05775 [Nitrososphaeria archaeon]
MKNVEYSINDLRNSGREIYLSLRHTTIVDVVLPYIKMVDGIRIMTGEPRNYCEEFLPKNLEKIRRLRSVDCAIPLEVDGCLNPSNTAPARNYGASSFCFRLLYF